MAINVNEMHVARILQIATAMYFNKNNNYSNLLMAIPDACNEWAKEWRIEMMRVYDPADIGMATQEEIDSIQPEIDRIKRLVSNAFQFPIGFIQF